MRALLLRGLLALALVLQGVPVDVQGATPLEKSAAAAEAVMPDCHGASDAPDPDPAQSPSPVGPDCCDAQGAPCGCDCLHAGSLALAAPAEPLAGPPGTGPAGLAAVGRPAGRQSPSLRPPIA